mmetsp:Transcript_57959/g.156319  ORF Transcript_57959/g.156319 Transcript_57959/m.156319 type:complete len:312 (-) Transcript_57959:14-949(-)
MVEEAELPAREHAALCEGEGGEEPRGAAVDLAVDVEGLLVALDSPPEQVHELREAHGRGLGSGIPAPGLREGGRGAARALLRKLPRHRVQHVRQVGLQVLQAHRAALCCPPERPPQRVGVARVPHPAQAGAEHAERDPLGAQLVRGDGHPPAPRGVAEAVGEERSETVNVPAEAVVVEACGLLRPPLARLPGRLALPLLEVRGHARPRTARQRLLPDLLPGCAGRAAGAAHAAVPPWSQHRKTAGAERLLRLIRRQGQRGLTHSQVLRPRALQLLRRARDPGQAEVEVHGRAPPARKRQGGRAGGQANGPR